MTASRLLHAANRLRIEYFYNEAKPSQKLAFVFSALGNRILKGNISGGSFLIENGFDVISFNSLANDWFQTVPPALFEQINQLAESNGYQRRVAVGSSMGGYAAICFSARLHCDAVLAYSPQYSVMDGFDGRFIPAAEKIESWNYWPEPDCIGQRCLYTLVYDNKDFDAVHARQLRALIGAKHTQEIRLPYAGHATIFYLFELGMLKYVTLNVLDGCAIATKALRVDRKRSCQYLTTLAACLKSANHLQLAERISALVGAPAPPPALLHWLIERRIALLSRLAESIEAYRLRRLKFDETFYRAIHYDVAIDGIDPVRHYIRDGRREGRLARFRD